MKAIGAIAAACAILAASAATAFDDDDMRQVVGEVGEELQACSVYFTIVSTCVADEEPNVTKAYGDAATRLGIMAIRSMRAAGVSDGAYIAGQADLAKAMMGAMNGNCVNIAVLIHKYLDFCQAIASKGTDERVKAWIGCIRAHQVSCGGPGFP